MNKLIIIVLSLLIASCKEKKNITPAQQQNTEDSTYNINVDTNIIISSFSTLNIPIDITHIQGAQQRIELSLDGVPENVTATLTKFAGYPGFNTTLSITTNFAKPGNYRLNITGTSANLLKKKSGINLIIQKFSCDTLLVFKTGRFITKLNGDSVYAQTMLTSSTGNPSTPFIWLLYLGKYNGYSTHTGNLASLYDFSPVIVYQYDCEQGTIIIPKKTIAINVYGDTQTKKREFTVWGQGIINYAKSTISISYTVLDYMGATNTYTMEARMTP